MDTFTVRDLRERTGELIRDAEQGKLSVVTKHGQPVFVAVPFDETRARHGLKVALAVRLFAEEVVSMAQAARIAGVPQEEFISQLASAGVPVVRYAESELDEELEALGVHERAPRYRGKKRAK